MEDVANINVDAVRAVQQQQQHQLALSTLTCSTVGLPGATLLPLDMWNVTGGKRRIPEEPFSAKKRKRDLDGSSNSGNNQQTISKLPAAPRTPSSSTKSRDRFIPNRANMDNDYNFYQLTKPADGENEVKFTPSQRKLKEELDVLKSGDKRRIIDCRATTTPTFDRMNSGSMRFGVEVSERRTPSKRQPRNIPTTAFKTLDAPNLMNDYYLNLLHWGSNNKLCVALGESVFLWHPETGQTDSLLELESPNSHVSSVQWSGDGKYLAVGTSLNTVQLWDVAHMTMLRELTGHQSRVSCLSWQHTGNNDILTSGGKDAMIINHDLRIARNDFAYFSGHTQEVCGLAWSPSGDTLASGGNDNQLLLWDAAMSTRRANNNINNLPMSVTSQSYAPRLVLDTHIAAVKAVAWCPWQHNILATGGGTADRTIRIWNSGDGSNLQCVDTGSQVCAIQWSNHYKELVSSHGFSDNQLVVWKYKDMSRLQELRGHSARVLHLAKSPDDTTICSASADETLCFWNVFEKQSHKSSDRDDGWDVPRSIKSSSSMNPSTPACMRGPRSASKMLGTPSASLTLR